jgi:uncharacterized protein
MALEALDTLWLAGRGTDGQMMHSLSKEDDRYVLGPISTLSDQIHIGLAAVAAHSTTGQRSHLEKAQVLAEYITSQLADPEAGGFFDVPANPNAPGILSIQQVDCAENVIAARFFTQLFRLTDDEGYREFAESALKRCGNELRSDAGYALAAEDLLEDGLRLAVVGPQNEPTTRSLREAANRFYAPGKVVVPIDPSEGEPKLGDFVYPANRIAIYACAGQRCSLPISEESGLKDSVAALFEE